MTFTVLLAEDNEPLRRLVSSELRGAGYQVVDVSNGESALKIIKEKSIDLMITDVVMPGINGIELLKRARELNPDIPAIITTGHGTPKTVIDAFKLQACDFLSKPFSIADLMEAIRAALGRSKPCGMEVVSAKPDWIELSVPCEMEAVPPILKFITELEADLPQQTRDDVGSAFREMLTNAIEHGGKLDPEKRVLVKYIRLKRAVLYSIKDPGEGFDVDKVLHAAVSNPDSQPLRHMNVRHEMGMRPGGYGILLASQVIDELVYNEKHNELIFVKYLDAASSHRPGDAKSEERNDK